MIQLTHAQVPLPENGAIARLMAAFSLRKGKADAPMALYDFTLWLGKGESWALLGAPGAGKTTLLRLIAGRLLPQNGICTVQGKVAAVIQQEDGLVRHETGARNVRLSCYEQNMKKEEIEERVKAVTELSGLAAHMERAVSDYDAAMRAKLVLSMAILAQPDVMLISNMLEQCDLPFRQQCVMELRRLQREGMTLLLESSDGALLQRLCDSALWLKAGRLFRLGTFETVYASYSYPGGDSRYSKLWVQAQNVAFSSPLAPSTETGNDMAPWPEEAKRALREAELYAHRLDDQLTAYAQANLAFEQENTRLDAALREQEARLWQSEAMLARVLNTVGKTTSVMHNQFELLGKYAFKGKR